MKTQQTNLWSLRVKTKVNGNDWDISLTASEESVLALLRMTYGTIEIQLKEMMNALPSSLPSGLVSEALILLRCLVFNKLEPINGSYVKLGVILNK